MPEWSETEDQFLELYYQNNTVHEIAYWMPNHSEDAIEARIKKLGLTKDNSKRSPNKKYWTHGELLGLKSRMLDANKLIAADMGRTTTSVRKMKEKLRKGLSFPVPGHEHEYSSDKGLRDYRRVAEEKVGRKLGSHEHVHHIDVNKKNNHPENLFVCNSPQNHGQIHAQLDNLLYNMVHTLIDTEVIKFEDGKYKYGKNQELIHLIATKHREEKKGVLQTWTRTNV